MLFVTNRVLQEGLTPVNRPGTLPRSIRFDLTNNQVEQSVYFCDRTGAETYAEIGSTAFLTALKNSGYREILFYIHGYNNLPESAIFPRAEELQRLLNQKSPNAVQVVPLIWPCDHDLGKVKDYYDDQMAADQSGVAFARMFQKFLVWRETNSTLDVPCTKRINVLAHSMGNRVLRSAFSSTVKYFLPQGMPLVFRNIFMAAADIGNASLEPGQDGELIPPAARNVVIYHAADDLAMRASKVANVTAEESRRQRQAGQIASRRLGHTGPADMSKVAKNVYALDCDDFNNDFDAPAGHGYFAGRNGTPSPAFNHIWSCIDTGRVRMEPEDAKTAILNRRWFR